MTKELIQLKYGEIGETFLRIPPGTTREGWNAIASRITSVGHGYWWWVGDLASYALHNFKDKDGEEAIEQLCSATGSGQGWIHALARCAKAYAVKDRIVGLSISHHIQAIRTPIAKRQALLRRAVKRHYPAERLGYYATPARQRSIRFILRIPPRYVNNRKFLADLKDFCQVWKITTYFMAGKKRRRTTKRIAGHTIMRAIA